MNAKILLILGAILGVIFLVILILFSGIFGRKPSVSPFPSVSGPTTVPNSAGSSRIQPQISPTSAVPLKPYDSSYFGFFYSPDLSITQGIADSEGYSVIVNAPVNFVPTFRIAIQVNPSNKVSAPQIKQTMEAFGLKSSSITVGEGISATEYKDISGKTQREVVLIEKGGYVYRLDLSYYSQTENPRIEGYYQEILSSFKPS
ncbi:MAG: hypothetical protein ACM3IJ_00865 [Candidatus Levyibacteriota bacterium]